MRKKEIFIMAGFVILAATALAVFSLKNDSLVMDELAHIPAGYSYLIQKDMRLNPEHPPLIKDIAAIPLVFENLKFDTKHSSWANDINSQWSAGTRFFYESGNDPDKIAFSARLSILSLFILLCIFVFKWGYEKYGSRVGLMALLLIAFSPNILAHARYVTTDIGAAFGFIFAAYYFIRFLKQPTKNNLIYAGLSFGVAQLLKFSLFLLIPLYVFVLAVFYLAQNHQKFDLKTVGLKYIKNLAMIFVIGYLVVWPVYQFHIWNYPAAKQKTDSQAILQSFPYPLITKTVVWMSDKPVLRPYAQYLLGWSMVFQRTGGGNTAYFMGQVSSTAWKTYFPTVYILKEPVPILILVVLALGLAINRVRKAKKDWSKLWSWITNNIEEFTWLSFIVIYWSISILGNLNIGLRHVLPTFPFIYLLVSGQIAKWFQDRRRFFDKKTKAFLLTVLLTWFVAESISAYPSYLAYFNELAGGPANGYKYAADSNLDWGQDLIRLKDYVDRNKIQKINVDYFGGASPKYYLGDKFRQMRSDDPALRHGWIAVSATLLDGGNATPVKGFDQNTSYYKWLNAYEPQAQIGYSIFIYKLD